MARTTQILPPSENSTIGDPNPELQFIVERDNATARLLQNKAWQDNGLFLCSGHVQEQIEAWLLRTRGPEEAQGRDVTSSLQQRRSMAAMVGFVLTCTVAVTSLSASTKDNPCTAQVADAQSKGESTAGTPQAELDARKLVAMRELIAGTKLETLPSRERGWIDVDADPSARNRAVEFLNAMYSEGLRVDAVDLVSEGGIRLSYSGPVGWCYVTVYNSGEIVAGVMSTLHGDNAWDVGSGPGHVSEAEALKKLRERVL